ncbi:MAG: PD40 domain-containing protein [Armatimonadetes bacterium]|nr:PD40 domain-containing protein [Armatimonadota bacterium]
MTEGSTPAQTRIRGFLVWMLAMLLLAGCGSGEFGDTSSTKSSTESAAARLDEVPEYAAPPQDATVAEPPAGVQALEARETVASRSSAFQPPAQVTLASTTPTGVMANGYTYYPDLNGDGRYLVFSSSASNLGFNYSSYQVYRKDLLTGAVEQVSKGPAGTGNSSSYSPRISASGDRVAFTSYAYNLVSGVTQYGQAYLRDVPTGQTHLLSSYQWTDGNFNPALGGPGVQSSWVQGFGGNNYVTFYTAAALVQADTNTRTDIYLRDLTNGVPRVGGVERVSVTTGGGQSTANSQNYGSVSTDGSKVTFSSNGADMGRVSYYDAILRNRTQNMTVSLNVNVGLPSSSTYNPQLSADGKVSTFVVYDYGTGRYLLWSVDTTTRQATQRDVVRSSYNSVSGEGRYVVYLKADQGGADANGQDDIYVQDLTTGQKALVSGAQFTSACSYPEIAEDGATVAWVAGGQVYIRANPLYSEGYQPPSVATVVSTNAAGEMGNGGWQGVRNPRINGNGRYLAFESMASNLHPEGNSFVTRVYRKDLVSGAVEIVSRQNGTNAPAEAYGYTAISADGSKVAFSSRRADLTSTISPGTSFTTGYVRDLTAQVTRLLGYKVNPSGFGGDDKVAVWTTERLGADTDTYYYDTFIHHLSTSVWEWVSQPPTFHATANSTTHRVSNDGRMSLFVSNVASSNALYLRDNQTGQVTLVTSSLYFQDFDISGDGRTIAYRTSTRQQYLDRLDDGQPARLVVSTQAGFAKLSDDGRYAVYQYTSWPVGTNSGPSGVMKVYDWNTGVSLDLDPGARYPQEVDISGDGRTVVFGGTIGSSNSQLFVKKNPHI